MDEGLDVSPGLLEDHRTNSPIVGISLSILGEEIICENASRRFVPRVRFGPCEMESKCISRTTISELWVPVSDIAVRNGVFEPIVLVDQRFHVEPNACLQRGSQYRRERR